MHRHVRIISKERCNGRRFVAADVVANDRDVAAFGLAGDNLAQEGNELSTGMTGCRFAQDFASGCVECGEQAQRAVALVFNSKPWLWARPGESGSIRSLRSRA